jgi:hypothetical protein
MKKTIIAMAILAALGLGAGISGAHAQEAASTCTTPGSVSLADIPTSRTEILPSQQRLIIGYGRAARAGGCKISLVCIATDSGDAAREVARSQCVAVRDTLTRGGFVKDNIITARENPGAGKTAGAVFFSVY